jgi:hypothetical protein
MKFEQVNSDIVRLFFSTEEASAIYRFVLEGIYNYIPSETFEKISGSKSHEVLSTITEMAQKFNEFDVNYHDFTSAMRVFDHMRISFPYRCTTFAGLDELECSKIAKDWDNIISLRIDAFKASDNPETA